MAFGCVLYLKSECDGCGWCDDCRHGLFGCHPCRVSDDEGNPFEDWEEE